VFTREAVRMIAKNSAETTTVYDAVVNLVRADSVYVTVPGINSGNETTAEEVFADAVESFGAGFKFKDNSASVTAVERNYADKVKEGIVSVKDYGAVGDDSTDDTAAITAAIVASNNRVVFFPPGTYRISSALIGGQGNGRIRLVGVAASNSFGTSRIRNMGTTTDAIYINDPGAGDYLVQDMEILTGSSTTGYAIRAAATSRLSVVRVTISGHKYGIDSLATQAKIENARVTLTDTAGVGIKVSGGTGGVVEGCYVIGPGTGGTSRGIEVGGNAAAVGCLAASLAVGLVAGSSSQGGTLLSCVAGSCTTGILVAASNSVVKGCRGYSNTTDLTASSVNDVEIGGNSVSTLSIGSTRISPVALGNYTALTSAAASPSWTPDMANGATLQHFIGSYAAAVQNLTVNNPTNTATLLPGTLVILNFTKTGANGLSIAWGASWQDEDLSTLSGITSISSNTAIGVMFIWTGTVMRRFLSGQVFGV